MIRIALALMACSQLLACDSTNAKLYAAQITAHNGNLLPVTTDLGYEVTNLNIRLAIDSIQLLDRTRVIGVTMKPAIANWPNSDNENLANAICYLGNYSSANILLRTVDETGELLPGDPLSGHTIELNATINKEDTTKAFSARLKAPVGAQIKQIEFNARIDDESDNAIDLLVRPRVGPHHNILDGLDFEALDADNNGKVVINPEHERHDQLLLQLTNPIHYQLIQ